MSEKKHELEAHLFVCTNRRENRECCASKGSEELREKVKKAAKARWGKRVRVNAAGCLGHCEEGIAAVLYPEGRWFVGLSKDDAALLEQALEDALEKKKL
jgi:(2Fe-2S) ferredoxin